jgi:hypothetical protein
MFRHSTVYINGDMGAKRQARHCTKELASCAGRVCTQLKMLQTDDEGQEIFVRLQTLGSNYIFM